MSKNKEVEIFGKKYIVRYKSIAWWIMLVGECFYWLTLSIFIIFDIWAFISIIILLFD